MEKQFKKENSLVVKGFAILLLLMYHLFENEQLVTSMGVDHSPFGLSGFLTFTGFGNICVAIFVFLTCFGISAGLFAKPELTVQEIYEQAVKRFFRLMKNFAILYVSVNMLWWYKFDYQSLYGTGKQGILHLVTDALGLSMFFDTPTLNMTWWYMELAYILIFLVPILVYIVKKTGYTAMLFAVLLPAAVFVQPDVERYLFTAVLGVCAAYGRWPDKLMNIKLSKAVQWIIGIAGFAVCVLVRQNFAVQQHYVQIADGAAALFLVYVAGVLLAGVPLLGNVLEFIGKHSMNIYLVHTFFYMSLWQKFIYQFHAAWAILAVLLGVTLLYSVCLEGIKHICVQNSLTQKFVHRTLVKIFLNRK